MTPWSWWVGTEGGVADGVYDVAECETRDEAVKAGCREVHRGQRFHIIEARCSTAKRPWTEEDALMPFLRTRNHEILTSGPTP